MPRTLPGRAPAAGAIVTEPVPAGPGIAQLPAGPAGGHDVAVVRAPLDLRWRS